MNIRFNRSYIVECCKVDNVHGTFHHKIYKTNSFVAHSAVVFHSILNYFEKYKNNFVECRIIGSF